MGQSSAFIEHNGKYYLSERKKQSEIR